MIPRMNIIAWSAKAPWAEIRQVEQDLIICRALVELFADPTLAQELRFRGGTALHKLHLPKPLRYSEDIDLVRTAAGPIGPVLDLIRDRLEPWLGRASLKSNWITSHSNASSNAGTRSCANVFRVVCPVRGELFAIPVSEARWLLRFKNRRIIGEK